MQGLEEKFGEYLLIQDILLKSGNWFSYDKTSVKILENLSTNKNLEKCNI